MQPEIQVLVLGGTEKEVQLWQAELEKVEYQTNFQGVSSLEQLNQCLQQLDWDLMLVKYPAVLQLEDVQQIIQEHQLSLPIFIIADHINNEVILEALSLGSYRCLPSSGVAQYLAIIARNAIEANRTSKEKEEAQRAVVENEQLYRRLFELSPDSVVLASLDGIILIANLQTAHFFGFDSPDEMVGHSYLDFMYPHEAELAIPFLVKTFEEGSLQTFRTSIVNQDGQVRMVEVSVSTVANAANEPYAYLVIGRDLTTRIHTEQLLHLSETRYQAIVEDQTELICRFLSDMKLTYVNKAFCNFYNITRESCLGSSFMPLLPAEDRVIVSDTVASLDAANPVRIIQHHAYEGTGKLRWIEWTNRAICDAAGYIIEYQAVGRDITERKEFEEAIQQANEELEHRVKERTSELLAMNNALVQEIAQRQAVEMSWLQMVETISETPDFVAICDPYGRLTYVNKTGRRMLGIDEQADLAAVDLYQIYPPDHRKQMLEEAFPQALQLGVWSGETTCQYPAGQEFPVSQVIIVHRTPEGLVGFISIMGRDLTEIKQAEHKVRTSEQRFRAIFDSSSLGISVTSIQGYSIQYNTAFRDMFGYSDEDLKTLTFMDMTHPEDVEPHLSLIQEVMAGKRNGFTLDKRYLKKNGDVLWGRLNVSVVRNLQGEPLFAISMVENITEKKLAEENLRRTKAQLQRMVRMSPVIIFSLDPANPDNVLFVSENLSLLFGYDEADFYRGIKFWSDLVHPDDLPHVIEVFKHLLVGEHLDLEFRLRNREGEYRWVHENVSLLTDETGKPVELIGTFMDITRRRLVDNELRQALEKEKELNELKTRFISMASHEFRTPLSTIMSSAELIEHYGKGWPENKRVEHLHRIQAAVLLLTGMLEEMLMVEKGETSNISYQPSKIHLINFIKQVVEEIELLDRGKHPFEVQQKVENPFILTDEKLLRPIMVNLLTNAVKYSHPGGMIRVEVVASDENISIQVQDSGIGIPESDMPHIFEPFHRCSNAGHIPGTGLGLTIVKRHLDLLGGTIEVTSQECLGTTFRINFPSQLSSDGEDLRGA